MTRLEAAARIAQIIRVNIEKNGGRYHGSMVPNLQSIVDLAWVPDEHFVGVPEQIIAMERKLGI